VGKRERMRTLLRSERRRRDNIKIELKEIRLEEVALD
jgi:hypothetical protein